MTRAFCALGASGSATVSAAAAPTDAAASAYGAQAACLQPLFFVCASWGPRGRGSDIALPSLVLRRLGGAKADGPRGGQRTKPDELKCVSRRGVVGGCSCKARELPGAPSARTTGTPA